MNNRVLITLLLLMITTAVGCQGTGNNEPDPETPDRSSGETTAPAGPQENLLADRERRELYLDLDNYTQRWMTVRNEGNTQAELSLHRTQIGPLVDKNLAELLNQVRSGQNHPRQITAARALGFTTRQGEVIPVLIMLLADDDANLVTSILVSLWLMANPETPITPLVDLLNDRDEDVRNNCAMALSAVLRARSSAGVSVPSDEVKRAAGRLVFLVSNTDENEFVRAHAASALGAIGDPAAVDVLVNLLDDGSSAVRTRSAEGLGQLGDEQAIPALIQGLQGQRAANERTVIVAALAKIAHVQGYPCDTKALGHDHENWRVWYMTVR